MRDLPDRHHRAVAITPLVGREREQAALREALAAAMAGRGTLVLIGGAAGIGKTTLAEALLAEAGQQGALVLVGHCYDLSETSPYGPWFEALARLAPVPEVVTVLSGTTAVASQATLFAQVQEELIALVARQPLVLLLDDLHWADRATLDLLRFLGRQLADCPLLLLAAYRADELGREHPLYQLLPLLVREAQSQRLDLRHLDADDLRALVRARYGLAPADEGRLVTYLAARSEGNPFFAGELLRALEEGRALHQNGHAWTFDDPALLGVPPLVRQVIDARLDRLGETARGLLAIAAVIGQDVPIALWSTVASAEEEELLDLTERAVRARVLDPTTEGARFAHALIREALYESILPLRRRVIHRCVAEALVATPQPDPDVVAYHFQRAGDSRAAPWLTRAGERALRVYALEVAAIRFRSARSQLADDDASASERGWLTYWIGWALRWIDQARASVIFGEARELALQAGDRALAALALSDQGRLRSNSGGGRVQGIAEQIAGIAALDVLTPAERDYLNQRLAPSWGHNSAARHGILVTHLSHVGRFADALALGVEYVDRPALPMPDRTWMVDQAWAHQGLADAYALLGQFVQARHYFAEAQQYFRLVGEQAQVGWVALCELLLAVLVATPEDIATREDLARAGADAFVLASTTGASLHDPCLPSLPHRLMGGHWSEVRLAALATIKLQPRGTITEVAQFHLGWIAWARGETELAWAQVRSVFPQGPRPAPADPFFPTALPLLLLGFNLELDASDHTAAYTWLAVRDQWLAWSGAIVGRSEGALGWATYHRALGDLSAAQLCAEAAFAHATSPRQPLALLAAHRLLGELVTESGDYLDAGAHLDAALALADACAAPYERALTLLALAELHAASGDIEQARVTLATASAILQPLEARPALARADALEARLAGLSVPIPAVSAVAAGYPAGLTAREVDVLRLIAQGRTNQEIAATLHISRHTVVHHVTHILNKTGCDNRVAVAAYAQRHGLT